MNWYQKTTKIILEELETDYPEGLSKSQVVERLKRFGPNVLASKKTESFVAKNKYYIDTPKL